MRSIVAKCTACEDVAVYSALSLPLDDPMMQGLDCSCQYLPYPGRAFELQDVELVLLPSTAASVPIAIAPLCGQRDEIAQLLAAQLAGIMYFLDFPGLILNLLLEFLLPHPPFRRAVCQPALEAAVPRCERVLRRSCAIGALAH
jgi:hypothetical protein